MQPKIPTDPKSIITEERKFLESMKAQIEKRLRALDQLQTGRAREGRTHVPGITIGHKGEEAEHARTYTVRSFAKQVLF